MIDAFVAALSLKVGGLSEIVIRKRLAKVRERLCRGGIVWCHVT